MRWHARASKPAHATATGKRAVKKHVLKITAKNKEATAREEHAVGAL
jgi:hypothetical protein